MLWEETDKIKINGRQQNCIIQKKKVLPSRTNAIQKLKLGINKENQDIDDIK